MLNRDEILRTLSANRADLARLGARRLGLFGSFARDEARALLRSGTSFIWNATNLSRRIRAQCIRLFADYGARIRIVYVEVSEPNLRSQNRSRNAPVPERVLNALLERWEVPDITEAHEVTYAVTD